MMVLDDSATHDQQRRRVEREASSTAPVPKDPAARSFSWIPPAISGEVNASTKEHSITEVPARESSVQMQQRPPQQRQQQSFSQMVAATDNSQAVGLLDHNNLSEIGSLATMLPAGVAAAGLQDAGDLPGPAELHAISQQPKDTGRTSVWSDMDGKLQQQQTFSQIVAAIESEAAAQLHNGSVSTLGSVASTLSPLATKHETMAVLLIMASILFAIGFLFLWRSNIRRLSEDHQSKEEKSMPWWAPPPSLQHLAPSPILSTSQPSLTPPRTTGGLFMAGSSVMASGSVIASTSLMPQADVVDLQAKQQSRPAKVPVLCPGFIVPNYCECTLLMPRLVQESGSGGTVITDLNSFPVLKATYSFPNQAENGTLTPARSFPASARGLTTEDAELCLALRTLTEDESILASCREGLSGALVIHDGSNRPFGLLQPRAGKVGSAYEIITVAGLQVHISMSTGEELSLTDCDGRVVAVTEPRSDPPDHRVVRVGPLTDAGLVVMSLLAIDLLTGARTEAFHRQLSRLDRN